MTSHQAGGAIAELHRVTGLTWEQLARLFGVSRRSLHFWASGKPMAPANEEHLQRLRAVIGKIDRGSARENRAALLAPGEDGSLPFDLLAAGHYERAFAQLGLGQRRAQAPRVSSAELAARAPRPPDERVDALQDPIHPVSGRLLAMKIVRVPRRK